MTKVKFCGLTRFSDIEAANALMPDLIGFVFWERSRRFVSQQEAAALRKRLRPGILAVGVFVDAPAAQVAALLADGVIDIAQLHGSEDAAYIADLRAQTGKPIFQAYRIGGPEALSRASQSDGDCLLLDAGMGEGQTFDWGMLEGFSRPYFLAGGLTPENAGEAVRRLHPYGLDVSSGIETGGKKDPEKMAAFLAAVRKEDQR